MAEPDGDEGVGTPGNSVGSPAPPDLAADMAVADVQDVLRLYDSFEGMAVHSWAAYEALDP